MTHRRSRPDNRPESLRTRPCRLLAATLAALGLSATAWGTVVPEITAQSAIVIERDTGEVLYEKNADVPRPVASLTKIMTAIVAMENRPKAGMSVISQRAADTREATAHLKAGTRVPFDDLMAMILLPSANDAAVAVAENVAGSQAAFVTLMNQTADRIGCADTHFANPHGLDADNHYSSARDLALLCRHFLSFPPLRQLVASREVTIADPNHPGETVKLENRNSLLTWRKDVDGIKTGTTKGAGECLAASARRGDRGYIVVVLNSEGRLSETDQLLTWAFDTFEMLPVLVQGDVVTTTPLAHGEKREIAVAPAGTLELLMRVDRPPPEPLLLQTLFEAPVRRGQAIGQFQLTYRGLSHHVPAVAAEDVPEEWWRRAFGWPQGVLVVGSALLLSISSGMIAHRALQRPKPRPAARRPRPRRAH